MKGRSVVLVSLAVLAVLSTSILQGASASREFPNTNLCAGTPTENVPAGPGGVMRYIVKFKPAGKSTTTTTMDTGSPANISLVPCETGGETTAKGARRICLACLALPGGTVTGTMLNNDCSNLSNSSSDSFICLVNTSGIAIPRLKVDVNPLDANLPEFVVNPKDSGTDLVGLTHTTNAGNAISTDPLSDMRIQITPNGFDGVVSFKENFVLGGTPRSGTVTTTGKSALQIAQDVTALFISFGHTDVSTGDDKGAGDPSSLFIGAHTRIRGITTNSGGAVKDVVITGVPGMLVEVEDSEPVLGVPAMSAWSIPVLVGLLLLMGVWLLRRRMTAQAS